jgi:hypothetical protein
MNTFNSGGSERPHWFEKIVRFAIPAGIVGAGLIFLDQILPFFTGIFNNLTSFFTSIIGATGAFVAMVVCVVPVVFAISYIMTHPQLVTMTYKNLCRRITKFFIKLDFLSYMDSYVEILKTKHANLGVTIKNLNAKKIELQRLTDEIVVSFEQNMKKASAAKKINDAQAASHHASMGGSDKESIDKYRPLLTKMDKSLIFLNKLSLNWGYSIEQLEHDIKRRRIEYETIKKHSQAIGQAEEFLRGDSEAARNYHLSIQALEESLTQKIAEIEKFEEDSKMLMKTLDLEQQMNVDEGMDLLNQYEENGNSIIFPDNFSKQPQTIKIGTDSEFKHLLGN